MLVTKTVQGRTGPHRAGDNAPCAALCVTILFRSRLTCRGSQVRVLYRPPRKKSRNLNDFGTFCVWKF
nr:MAG TPA: hypothetical protein [Caudoviricetes sp.]